MFKMAVQLRKSMILRFMLVLPITFCLSVNDWGAGKEGGYAGTKDQGHDETIGHAMVST